MVMAPTQKQHRLEQRHNDPQHDTTREAALARHAQGATFEHAPPAEAAAQAAVQAPPSSVPCE